MTTPKHDHFVSVKIRFDKPVTRVQAVKDARHHMHGDYYCGSYSEADLMKILSVKTGKMKGRK